MYYVFISGIPVIKTNDIVTARKQLIKRVMRFPKYEWSSYRSYITTDAAGKNKTEEVVYANESLNPNAYPMWWSRKKGSSYWREIVWDGSSDDGYIVPQSIPAMNLNYKRAKKITTKRLKK